MKMLGFILISFLLGGGIAAYIKLPKTEDTKNAIQLIKFFIVIMSMTLFVLFTFAVFSSTMSIKLF
jgi:hypothetical protein